MHKFHSIGLIGKQCTEGTAQCLLLLINYLKKHRIPFVIEEKTAPLISNETFKKVNTENLSNYCDLIIVVGGDGSLLSAARALVSQNLPLLGINRGRLGFLTDIKPENIEKNLNEILLEGQYLEEKRFLLKAFTTPGHYNLALNEAVLTSGQAAQMLDFEIYINDVFMYSQRSDGILVATPTGSTAYALSAGGPILYPQLDAIAMIPLCPHSLMNRPIVIGGDSKIKIILGERSKTLPQLICDSQSYTEVHHEDHIHIEKHSLYLRLIHPLDYNYFESLRSKLYWGKKLTESEK